MSVAFSSSLNIQKFEKSNFNVTFSLSSAVYIEIYFRQTAVKLPQF